jgi:hypothetical protein
MARRARKFLLRTLLGICVIAALALLIVSAVLPMLARQRVELALRDLGVRQSSFSVTNASFSGIRLSNVRLGDTPWLDADRVQVDYSAASLSQSRVTFLTIENAVYRIAYREGAFDFGFEPEPTESATSDVPLSSVTLRDCVIVFELPDAAIRFNVDGTIVRNGVGRLAADLKLRAAQTILINNKHIEIAGFQARLPVQIAMSSGQIELSLLAGNTVETSAESFVADFARTTQLAMSIAGVKGESLLRLSWGERDPGLWMNAAIASSSDVHVSAEAVQAELGDLAASIAYRAPDYQAPQIEGIVQVRNGRAVVPNAGLALNGIELNSPYAINLPTTQRGTFHVESMTWGNRMWPAIDGTLALTGAGVEASAKSSPVENAMLTAEANLSIAEAGLLGEVVAHVPRFEWRDESMLDELFPNAGNPQLGGEFAADARLSFAGGGAITPNIEVRAYDASLTGDEWPIALEKFSGEFIINGFSPLRSPPDQPLHIHRAMMSDIPIVDGKITYSIEGANRIRVHQASWSMEDLGQFATDSFAFDPASPRIEAQLRCERVGLAPWMKLMTGDRIHGEGELSGELALMIQPLAREKFAIHQGYLFAEPAGGWIQTDDSESISRILDQGTASLSGDERLGEVRDRVVAALQDYQYTMLRLHFIPTDQGLLCTLMTKGRGRQGRDAQEIESLTINLHGFDDAIRAALAGKSLWDMTD